MKLTIDEEQRQEIEAGLKLQRTAIEKNKKSNEDLGNWAGVKEADRRLRIINGGPGGETGLLELVYRESKDQGPLFNGKDGDGVSVREGQSIDEALEGVEEEGAKREAAKASAEAEESAQGEGTPLTKAQQINPTMLAILSDAGITTLEQLAAHGREATGKLKGLGPKKLETLGQALGEHGLLWADLTHEDEAELAEMDAAAETAAEPNVAESAENIPTETEEPIAPDIGDVVIPEKNLSFTLEVVSYGFDGDADIATRVNLRARGAAASDTDFRYALMEDLTWDPEHGRWTTSKLYTFEKEPAGV